MNFMWKLTMHVHKLCLHYNKWWMCLLLQQAEYFTKVLLKTCKHHLHQLTSLMLQVTLKLHIRKCPGQLQLLYSDTEPLGKAQRATYTSPKWLPRNLPLLPVHTVACPASLGRVAASPLYGAHWVPEAYAIAAVSSPASPRMSGCFPVVC